MGQIENNYRSKMADLNLTISITSNVNSLTTTSKRPSNKIQSKNYLSSTKRQLSILIIGRLRLKGWKKIY